MSFFEVGDVRLFFTDEGAGDPPLLFVHGYTCDSHDWSWQIPYFAARHRVIAADLRGHGRSGAPEGGHEPASFADDLAALLVHLGCESVVAIGHSLGGLVVSALAVRHPALVLAIVAVEPAYLVPDDVIENVTPLRDALSEGDPVPIVQAIIEGADVAMTPAFLRCWHRRRVAGVPAHVLRDTLAHMSSGTSDQFVGRRACPVLSFWTDPSRAAAEEAFFGDARSRSEAWDGAGHWLHQERPEAFNERVDAWLSSL